MKLYIYPQNLKATANLWLWSLRDFALICVGLLVSFVVLTQVRLLLPLAVTAAFAFLSVRMDELTVLDYIRFAAKFTISTPLGGALKGGNLEQAEKEKAREKVGAEPTGTPGIYHLRPENSRR